MCLSLSGYSGMWDTASMWCHMTPSRFIYVLTNEGIQRGIAKLISELTAKGNHRDALRAFRLARSVLILLSLFASILLYAMAPLIATASKSPQATIAIRALSPYGAHNRSPIGIQGLFPWKKLYREQCRVKDNRAACQCDRVTRSGMGADEGISRVRCRGRHAWNKRRCIGSNHPSGKGVLQGKAPQG